METQIQISVIMPAYNAETFIEQAIESVLKQTMGSELELIIIDDGSRDHTAECVEKYRDDGRVVFIQHEKNAGVAESRNAGIRAARGKYIAFLDADDWWTQDKLEQQYRTLKENGMVLCCTGRELRNADGSKTGKYIGVPERITYEMLLRTNYIPCSSVLLKTEVAREFYMCHDELHEDYILWLQILKKYKEVCGMDQPFLMSRMSGGGKSRNKIKSARMQFGVYRYMKIPVYKAIFYFLSYMICGVKKYL